jgi:hypothetical protein
LVVVLAGHRAHLSYTAKLGFDDTDYSVVVKNRGVPPKSWRWEIYRAGRSNPIGQSPVFFSHRGGRQQSRKGGTQAVTGQAQHLAIAFSKISVEA